LSLAAEPDLKIFGFGYRARPNNLPCVWLSKPDLKALVLAAQSDPKALGLAVE